MRQWEHNFKRRKLAIYYNSCTSKVVHPQEKREYWAVCLLRCRNPLSICPGTDIQNLYGIYIQGFTNLQELRKTARLFAHSAQMMRPAAPALNTASTWTTGHHLDVAGRSRHLATSAFLGETVSTAPRALATLSAPATLHFLAFLWCSLPCVTGLGNVPNHKIMLIVLV